MHDYENNELNYLSLFLSALAILIFNCGELTLLYNVIGRIIIMFY